MESEGFADIDEVLEFAGGISRATLYRWGAAGYFPLAVKIGQGSRGRVGWRRSELLRWAASPSGWEVDDA